MYPEELPFLMSQEKRKGPDRNAKGILTLPALQLISLRIYYVGLTLNNIIFTFKNHELEAATTSGIREGFYEVDSNNNGTDQNDDPESAESGRSGGWGRRQCS